MTGYYEKDLSGRRLQRCYDLAPARIQQYLEAELCHVVDRLCVTDTVLELGCGYGRLARRLARAATRVIGIDTATESVDLARQMQEPETRCEFMCMDALDLQFPHGTFDAVVCLQNGICAFGVDQVSLLAEALRVTGEGGTVLFSTYSDGIWPQRLAWFEAQAAHGLIGAIDHAECGDGTIVCKDGFRAGRLTREGLRTLCSRVGVEPTFTEVDGSSLFCEIIKPVRAQDQT